MEQENGGRIVGAYKWKDRQWQLTCGITFREVKQAHNLLTWDGDDLVVWNYPSDDENELKAKREGARAGNQKRWRKIGVSQSHSDIRNGSDSDSLCDSHTDSVSEPDTESRREKKRVEKNKIPPTPQERGVGGEEIVEEIYGLYPRKTKHRDMALEAIRATLLKIDAATLKAALGRYLKTPGLDRDGWRAVPAPAAWFGNGCWKDYLTKAAAPRVVVPVPSKALGDVRLMLGRPKPLPPEERALALAFIKLMPPDDYKFLTDEERLRINDILGTVNADLTTLCRPSHL